MNELYGLIDYVTGANPEGGLGGHLTHSFCLNKICILKMTKKKK